MLLNALIIVLSLSLFGVIIHDTRLKNKEKEEIAKNAKLARIKENKRLEQEAIAQKKFEFDKQLEVLSAQYGSVTAKCLLRSNEYLTDSYLFVFEEAAVISLHGETIPFSKILGFSLNDNSETIMRNESSYTSTTTTDTGNMLGRAAVGGILFGGAGALVGATTAKKETVSTPTINQSTTTIKHNYRVYLNIDDLANPTRIIEIGTNQEKAQHIANIFNIIAQRTK